MSGDHRNPPPIFEIHAALFFGDILVFKLLNFSLEQNICSELDVGNCDRFVICVTELDTSELVELLQKYAVEHLTTCRQLESQRFISLTTIVTTDYEALYAYKLGDCQRCLQLSAQNVQSCHIRVSRAMLLCIMCSCSYWMTTLSH